MYKKLSIIFLSTIITIFFLFPIILNFKDHLYSHDDGLFIAWTIDTVAEKIMTGDNFYQLPILSGYENTLTFSDPFLPTAILSIPLKFFTDNVVFIHNIHLVFSSILTFLSMWGLAKFLYKTNTASFISAIVFSFSSMHLKYLVHLQIFSIAGLPLSILFFLKWTRKLKIKYLILSALFFMYQTLNAPETGFFLSFIFLLIFLSQKDIRYKIFRNLKTVIPIFFVTLLIALAFYYPYFISAQTLDSERTIRDAAHFSANVNEFFSVELISIILLLIFLYKKITSHKSTLLSSKTLILIGITGAVLMLGPVLKINDHTAKIFSLPIPLPYGLFYYLMPGFKAFRATSRWIVLLNFALALLLGKFMTQAKLKQKYKIWTVATLTIVLAFLQFNKYPTVKIELTLPLIYTQLSNYPDQTLLELPAYTWDVKPLVSHESQRLFYQTFHHQYLFNGTSGYIPPQREREFHFLTTNFPSDESLDLLLKYNVSLILVNFDQYFQLQNLNFFQQLDDLDTLRDKIKKQSRLQPIPCHTNHCLYQLLN